MCYTIGMKTPLVLLVAGMCGVAVAATNAVQVVGTMTVRRCQAVLKDGRQCPYQAEGGQDFCWRHRGAAKAVKDAVDDAGKGANQAWQATKTWSTNAWQTTRDGVDKAMDATRDAVEDARVGLVEMLGGKDAKGPKESKAK